MVANDPNSDHRRCPSYTQRPRKVWLNQFLPRKSSARAEFLAAFGPIIQHSQPTISNLCPCLPCLFVNEWLDDNVTMDSDILSQLSVLLCNPSLSSQLASLVRQGQHAGPPQDGPGLFLRIEGSLCRNPSAEPGGSLLLVFFIIFIFLFSFGIPHPTTD